MFGSIATILASLAGIVRGLMNRWLAKEQQQIGRNEVALDALIKEREDAKRRAELDAEIARLDNAGRDARLDPWMRD